MFYRCNYADPMGIAGDGFSTADSSKRADVFQRRRADPLQELRDLPPYWRHRADAPTHLPAGPALGRVDSRGSRDRPDAALAFN